MSDLWGPEKSDGAGDELTPKRLSYIEQCRSDPASYFWGKDPESNLYVVRTLDAHDKVTPIKPLPTWPYLGFVLARFAHRKKVVIDKPRQLMVSWLLLLWFDYLCLFQPYRTCLLNKATMDEAKRMLFKRLGVVHKHWPKWFADWAQVVELKSEGEIRYERAGGVIVATGENVEDRAARGDQAASSGVDEAARHPQLREVIAALAPMSDQMILVSTPELGTPGAQCFAEILKEGEE
jgi:hypothetical protein